MAVRKEKVILELEDRFTTPMAKAAVAAAMLDKNLKDLDGSSVGARRGMADTSRDVDAFGVSARRTGLDIDRLSGRVRLLADATAILGPGLVPIGAVAVPAVAALASQFGFAALGAGSLVAASQGVGEALEAVSAASLEPTAANLEAAQVAMARLAPEAQRFVAAFEGFRPVLADIRDSGAAGWFPGLTESLDHLAVIGPRVADTLEAIGRVGGNLLAEGAEALTGPRWTEFLDFVQATAPQALDQLGRTIGNVASGLASLTMAFGPLSADFNAWLLDASRGFASWADGLSETEGFREFVEYVREAGPQVAEAAGAIGNAVLQIVQAAAPLGGPVLTALTAVADAVGAIAGSNFGAPLLAAVSAMSAMRLGASALDSVAQFRLGLEGVGTSAGRARTAVQAIGAGATFAGILASIDFVQDKIDDLFDARIDDSNLTRTLESIGGGRATDELDKMAYYVENLNAAFLEGTDKAVGWLPGQTDFAKAREEIEKVDQALASMVESGRGDTAAAAFDKILAAATESGVSADEAVGSFDAYRDAVANAAGASDSATRSTAGLRRMLDGTAGQFGEAADGADDLSRALSRLSGWLDRRQAIRDYRDSVRGLSRSMRDGFTRGDVENLDAVARNIEQVARSITNPRAKTDFLAGARRSLEQLADQAGPKARAAIEGLIRQMENVGVFDIDTRSAERKLRKITEDVIRFNGLEGNPFVDLYTAPFDKGKRNVDRGMNDLDGSRATVGVDANVGPALAGLSAVQREMAAIPRSITTTVNTVRNFIGGGFASGGFTAGAGSPDTAPTHLTKEHTR